MHATGHGFLAGAAGALARTLSGAPLMDARSSSLAAAFGTADVMLALAIVGMFAAIAKLVGGVLSASAEARLSAHVGAEVRLDVLERVLGPRHGDHGEPLAAMTVHVADVERGVCEGVLAEVRAALALAPLVVLLVVLAPKLAASALVALGAFALFAFFVRRAFKRAHARAAASAGSLVAAADEAVRHAELWATYGATKKIRAHVARIAASIAAEGARLRARAALLSGTSEVLGALALVLALALAASGAIGGVDRGAIIPFAIVFFMAYKPLRDLVDARIQRARAQRALAQAVGGRRSAVSETRRAWPPAPLVIEGFATEHGKHAPITVRVPAGHVAAIVGDAGIGKTSLLRALLGLDRPRTGRVLFGGEDVTHAEIGPGARPFAWVPQDAPVISDTLAANVALGAAEDVGGHASVLHDLGTELDTGDAVLATERPVSGGERQWIAVARAIATDLPVLLLDEPTSALDAASQERVLAAIARLRGKKTVLLVTHRKEPLAIADVVVELSATSTRADDAQHDTGLDRERRRAKELAVEDVRVRSGPRELDA